MFCHLEAYFLETYIVRNMTAQKDLYPYPKKLSAGYLLNSKNRRCLWKKVNVSVDFSSLEWKCLSLFYYSAVVGDSWFERMYYTLTSNPQPNINVVFFRSIVFLQKSESTLYKLRKFTLQIQTFFLFWKISKFGPHSSRQAVALI